MNLEKCLNPECGSENLVSAGRTGKQLVYYCQDCPAVMFFPIDNGRTPTFYLSNERLKAIQHNKKGE